MSDPIYNVLFVCTGNSARRLMAECILNRLGQGRFRAFSAGSHPSGWINPYALKRLENLNYPTGDLRSKDWSELASEGAPPIGFVFTVCDRAAGEACPAWPGRPMTTHWGFPDPAAFEGTEAETAALFAEVYAQIERVLSIFVSLSLATLDRLSLRHRLADLVGKQS
jgi:protein-tyrosine-phosphatase